MPISEPRCSRLRKAESGIQLPRSSGIEEGIEGRGRLAGHTTSGGMSSQLMGLTGFGCVFQWSSKSESSGTAVGVLTN
jgi:hypothetical protein